MSSHIETIFHPDTFTLTHVLHDGPGSEAAVIDTVLDYNPTNGRVSTEAADLLIAHLEEKDLKLRYVLETHVHADHLTAAKYLQHRLGAKVGISKHVTKIQKEWAGRYNTPLEVIEADASFDLMLADGDQLPLNGTAIGVMETPGHTPACVTYTFEDAAFVGDTMFMPDYGTARCDFPDGDGAMLYRSLQKTLSLPDETRLHMCHDYQPGGRELKWMVTVAEQKAANIHLTEYRSEEAFAAFRATKDAGLSTPRLLWPAIQVNIRGGGLPAPEENGARYLKIPVGGDAAEWT